jgi:putative endopeptidase
MELDAELLPQLFPNFPENKVIELVQDIRQEILKGIKNNSWLSKKARDKAFEKIQRAELLLVKPKTEKQWNFHPIGKYSATQPILNSKTFRKIMIEEELNSLKQPRDKTIWLMGPLEVNAYYSPSENLFALPIGILQPPFFDPQGSQEKNLGGIGTIIGHELGHAIDDKNSLFDASGQKNDWMTMEDRSRFAKLSEPMVEQFNKSGLDGNLTLGENIADLVGITFAYRAAFPNDKGSLEKKREFFLQQGRLWCGVVRPKHAELRAKTDTHADFKGRVNEQLKHQKGFSEAFQCKKGDPMFLPEDKRVVIW